MILLLGAKGYVGQAFADGYDLMFFTHRDPDYELLWDYPPFQRFLQPKG